jgi:hypothetical protein
MRAITRSSNTFDEILNITKPFMPSVKCKTFETESVPNHFGTVAWNLITKKVVELIIEEMKTMNTGDIFMYIDTDILMLEKPEWFAEQLGDCDFKFQYETGFGINFGFFVARVSPDAIDFLQQTADGTNETNNSQISVMNVFRHTKLKVEYFDTKDVWNYAVYSDGKLWDGKPFPFPEDIKAFHANFTIGVEQKKEILNMAIAKYIK